jgi:hypothetical protein
LFHERFDESLNIPLHDYIRALLIKKVNGFEHKGAAWDAFLLFSLDGDVFCANGHYRKRQASLGMVNPVLFWKYQGHVGYMLLMLRRGHCNVTERRSVILYGTGCRLSHSCKPNCFRTVLPDGRLLVRAVAPTAAGDELAISYLRPEKMFSSAKERCGLT